MSISTIMAQTTQAATAGTTMTTLLGIDMDVDANGTTVTAITTYHVIDDGPPQYIQVYNRFEIQT